MEELIVEIGTVLNLQLEEEALISDQQQPDLLHQPSSKKAKVISMQDEDVHGFKRRLEDSSEVFNNHQKYYYNPKRIIDQRRNNIFLQLPKSNINR